MDIGRRNPFTDMPFAREGDKTCRHVNIYYMLCPMIPDKKERKMPITIEEVERISTLAKLRFSGKEKAKLAEDLNDILRYMEKLNELTTDQVEPLSHPIEIANVLRDDRVKPSLPSEEALSNAPARQGSYFKVPKVIK